jgi:hypothetical protein
LRSKKQKNTNTHSCTYLQFMSLNDIRLDPILTAEMYKNHLVENDDNGQSRVKADPVPEQPVPGPAEPDKGWKYLGKFGKKILLVVDYENAAHIPDDDLNFLTSILSACKLNLADVAILNLANAKSRLYKDIQPEFKSGVTILFGSTPQALEMPVNFPEFQIQPFNSCTFLSTPAIELIAADKVLKSKLWVCLRKMFGV